MKKCINRILVIVCVITVFMSNYCSAAQLEKLKSFSYIIKENNITVIGDTISLELYEFSGLVEMCNISDNSSIKLKYENNNSSLSNKVITPEEILELHYYSLEPSDRNEFISKIVNQTVNISMKNDIILISYNVNVIDKEKIEPMATTNYTSTREAVIKMQDSIDGKWGSATVSLTGYFTKTTTDISYWRITPTDYDFTEKNDPPVFIVTTVSGMGYSVLSNGPYLGNETYVYCDTYVFCPMDNNSSLKIRVFPNSNYNYAYIE